MPSYLSFLRKYTLGTPELFAGSENEGGEVNGTAFTSRFEQLIDAGSVWDTVQRPDAIPVGNRFYVADSNKLRMIHECGLEMITPTRSIFGSFTGTGSMSGVVTLAPIQFTYSFTGTVQMLVVPDGIVSMTVECTAAPGRRSGSAAPEGRGAYLAATLPAIPGNIYNVYVGGRGTNAGGWPNGGHGGVANNQGSGGGGASYLVLQSSDLGVGVTTNALVVAGAGGGGSDLFHNPGAGGDGGYPDGHDPATGGATGATQSTPGTGYEDGDTNGYGFGGDGQNSGAAPHSEGGGGGGGWHGGGGGWNSNFGGGQGGGGGGSSWIDPSGTYVSSIDGFNANGNDGLVVVTLSYG